MATVWLPALPDELPARHVIALIGAGGQLGRQVPVDAGLTRADLDLAQPDTIAPALDAMEPRGIILTAAYTNVDGCETNRDHAFLVNGEAPGHVARWCAAHGAWLLFISTNCVFDGQQQEPYDEDAEPRPISAYGASKLAGEDAVRTATERHFIVRTSWLFGPGGANFVAKVLALAAQQPVMRGVADEVACPTYAPDLGPALRELADSGQFGTYHLTNDGAVSRLDYMRAILAAGGLSNEVEPIGLADFERPSRPPAQSALANNRARALGLSLRPWQDALEEYVGSLSSREGAGVRV
jgi:dTDP-4-dehydrorhamnose reductase